jgi:hypothetical protein
MLNHWSYRSPHLACFIDAYRRWGATATPFLQAACPAPNDVIHYMACSLMHLLRPGSLFASQEFADTAQRQIVAEDAKAGHRTAADTGNL